MMTFLIVIMVITVVAFFTGILSIVVGLTNSFINAYKGNTLEDRLDKICDDVYWASIITYAISLVIVCIGALTI